MSGKTHGENLFNVYNPYINRSNSTRNMDSLEISTLAHLVEYE